jgi:hypothetical protein
MRIPETGTPCTECGTTGGSLNSANKYKPWRARGLCRACYMRAYNRGQHREHALTGKYTPPHAHFPTDLTDTEAIARYLWTGADGKRQEHAIDACFVGQVGPIVDQLFEHAADLWVAAHPHLTAHFEHPEYARYGSPQERAA